MLSRVFRRITMIQAITFFTTVVSMLVDSIIIGSNLGVVCVAAYGLAAPLLTLFAAVGGTFQVGCQTLTSNAIGVGDTKKANQALSVTFFIALIVSLVGTAVIFLCATPLAKALGAGSSPELLENTVGYLRGYVLGAPGLILVLILLPVMQLDSDNNRTIAAAGALTIVDIVFDLMNVYVFHGGMFGMGLASALSVYAGLIILLLHFTKKKNIFHLSFRGLDLKLVGPVMNTGFPYALGSLCRTFLVFTLNRILLGVSGQDSVAAFSVVNTLFSVMSIPGSAVSEATLMLSSIMAGEKNKKGLFETLKLFITQGAVINIIVAVIFFIAAPFLVPIFVKEGSAHIISMAVTGTRIVAFSMILACIDGSFRNYYQGIGRMGLTRLMCVLTTYVALVVPALILTPFLGETGVWISYILADVIVLCLLFFLAWRNCGHRPASFEDLSFLPKNFGPADEDLKEYSLASIDDVMAASVEISDFCKNKGADLRTRMVASLAVEELGSNVIQHAMHAGKNDHFEVRIIHERGSFIIRMRDDCKAFNPKDYVALYQKEDPTESLGIRMIVGTAHDVQYMNTLSLNNLIIKV